MKNELRLGCVVMASGFGRRFGGNKLTAAFCGLPMIARILSETRDLFEERVVVTRHMDVAEICREMHINMILNDLPGRNDTIHLGIDAIGDGIDGCMFCPGDMPLLHRDSIKALLDAFSEEPECIWRLGDSAPVIFPAWAFQELKHLPEGVGGAFLMRKYPEQVRSIAPHDINELRDADTPEALNELEQLFEKGDSR